MKTTEAMKARGPVFVAQYEFVFGKGASSANPYEVGTQAHASFAEEMEKLVKEQQAKFDNPTPEGVAFADYLESVNDNPYFVGSDEYEQYERQMTELMLESRIKEQS